MSTALDHELEEAERRESSAVRPQGPKPRPAEKPPQAATGASAWKRDEPEMHTLPSGNVAYLERPSIMEQLRKGEIPNPLLSAALEVAQGEPLTDYQEAAEFLAFMVASAFVEPKVTLEDSPANGELPIKKISDEDRRYVLAWVQRGVAGLASFRDDPAGTANSSDGGGVRDEAE